MDRRVARLITLVCACACSLAAAQDPAPRVALVAPGAELETAVRSALEPWGVQVLIVPGPSPGATAPDSNEAARALATAHGATALAWVSEHDGRHALWVYDLATHHAIERALTQAPPFDGAASAALALTVKTLLRHSAAAPPDQRYGVNEAGAARTPAPVPAPVPAGNPPGQAPTAVPAAPADPREAGDAGARSLAPSRFELALRGAARFGATDRGAVEGRFGLAASWWPARGPFGMTAGATLGPPLALRDARFDGQLFDAAGSLALAARHDFTQQVRAQAALQAALHLLRLHGTLPDESRDLSVTRASPSLALELGADWALAGPLRLGLYAQLTFLIRTERYLVHEQTILELTHLAAQAGLTLTTAL